MSTLRRVVVFLLISTSVYLTICLVLIFWPVPQKKNVENYDYSSLQEIKGVASRAEEKWITLRDHSKMFYRFYDSKASATLIMIHGSGSESRYLQPFAEFLSDNGFAKVLTPDMRGHGRTSRLKGDIDYLGQYEDDLEDLIQSIRSKNSEERIILGGHSSGGGLVLRYAGNLKVEEANAYLLFAPYLGHKAPTVKPNSGEWVTVALKRFIGISMLNNMGITYFNHMPALFFNLPETWNDSLQTPSYSYRLAMSFQPQHYKDDIEKIRKPTLLFIGEKDESFYPGQFAPLFAECPIAEVQIINGAKHLDVLNNSEARGQTAHWIKSIK